MKARLLVVDDESAIRDTMRMLFERTKQVVEPSGATALAAVLSGAVGGYHVGVVLSGGNIGISRFARLCSTS